MKLIEEKLGYKFKEEENFIMAITHSSYAKEETLDRNRCNERLEFLGDSILGAVISQALYLNTKMDREGNMAKMKASIVKAETLAKISRQLNLGEYLLLSRGEELQGGKNKMNILADALEAIIGAIFLESGYDEAKRVILNIFEDTIEKAHQGLLNSDYKSRLQELAHKIGATVSYELEREEGQSHDKTFFTVVYINHEIKGRGVGKNKKTSENLAAKEAISALEGR